MPCKDLWKLPMAAEDKWVITLVWLDAAVLERNGFVAWNGLQIFSQEQMYFLSCKISLYQAKRQFCFHNHGIWNY